MEQIYGKSEQGDLLLLPDPESVSLVPWKTSRNSATARFICDIISSEGEKFLKNPRYMTERMETNLSAIGVKNALVGSEIEFYIREAMEKEAADMARMTIAETVGEMGFDIRTHGLGRSASGMQQRFHIHEYGVKRAADALTTFKMTVKGMAGQWRSGVTFMPAPFDGDIGSMLGVHLGLFKTADNNLFYDAADEYAQISQTARYFIGGLLEHAPALCLFSNPTSNSYRRLAADPKRIGWSKTDTQAVVRVLNRKKNDKEGKMVTFALADSAANPYLAYPTIMAAGIDGIKSKTDPGDALESNKKKQAKLPESLKEAAEALESDSKFLKGVFSAEIIGDYAALKLAEHREGARAVSDWEMARYANV
jgi:glutamine synthetase